MSEPTDQILSAIAHELTGLVAANCCAKTGGRGGEAGKHCECRETALDVYRAAAPLIRAAALERAAEMVELSSFSPRQWPNSLVREIAAAIRALKEQS